MIEVLISTYNGEKYLAEQLESLLRQSYSDLRISIRDDGSTDRTLSIVKKFAEANPGVISLRVGHNLGCTKSFLTLLENSGDADFYAFCDQDDVWYDDKLERAANVLKTCGGEAVLYASAYQQVTETLVPFGRPQLPKEVSFRAALTECLTFGCTMVMNRAARDLILTNRPTQVAVTHDWWCYLVVSAMGRVIYDPTPSLLYRQHSRNLTGAYPSFFTLWINRLKRKKRKGELTPWHRQAISLARLYGPKLNADRLRVLKLIEASQSNLLARCHLAFSSHIRREKFLDEIIFRLMVLLGAYQSSSR